MRIHLPRYVKMVLVVLGACSAALCHAQPVAAFPGCELLELARSTNFYITLGPTYGQGAFQNLEDSRSLMGITGYCPVSKTTHQHGNPYCEFGSFVTEPVGDRLCDYSRRLVANEEALERYKGKIESLEKHMKYIYDDPKKGFGALAGQIDGLKKEVQELKKRLVELEPPK